MKIKYSLIAELIIIILRSVAKNVLVFGTLYDTIRDILLILFWACLALIIYQIIRNIFRAIKGIVTKPKEGRWISGGDSEETGGASLPSKSKGTLKSKNQDKKPSQKGKCCEEGQTLHMQIDESQKEPPYARTVKTNRPNTKNIYWQWYCTPKYRCSIAKCCHRIHNNRICNYNYQKNKRKVLIFLRGLLSTALLEVGEKPADKLNWEMEQKGKAPKSNLKCCIEGTADLSTQLDKTIVKLQKKCLHHE